MSKHFIITILLLLTLVCPLGDLLAQPAFKDAVLLPYFPTSGKSVVSENAFIQSGAYIDPVDFDGDGIPDMTNRGGSDIFIASYALDGTLNWIQTAGGSEPMAPEGPFGLRPNESGQAIVQDDQGNFYVAGVFDEAADFDYDGMADVFAVGPDTTANFIAKYSADGVFQWVKQIGSFGGYISSLNYSPARQSVYVSTTFLASSFEVNYTPQFYFAEIDNDGNSLFEQTLKLPIDEPGNNFVVTRATLSTKGNLYITGHFIGTIDLDGEGPVAPITSSFDGSRTSYFLAKIDVTGSLQWINTAENTTHGEGRNILTDESENVYVTGFFRWGEITFSSEGLVFTGSASVLGSIFIAKYTSSGALQWAWMPTDFSVSNTSFSRGRLQVFDLTLYQDKYPLISGVFGGTFDFDDDGEADLDGPFTDLNPFMVLISDKAQTQWTWTETDAGYILDFMKNGDNTIVGYSLFVGSADFDGPGGLPPIYSADSTLAGNALITFELPDVPLPVTLTDFTATTDGNAAVLTWHTASEINNAGFEILHGHASGDGAGRDLGGDGESHASGGSVRAIHESPLQVAMDGRATFIPGAGTTNEPQTYTHRIANLAPGIHTFQLKQIDFDGGFALSDVVSLSIDLTKAYQLSKAYPNPFNPQATFHLSVAQTQEVEVALYDVLGRRVQSIYKGMLEANSTRQFVIDGSGLSSGTYLYRVTGERFSTSEQILLMK